MPGPSGGARPNGPTARCAATCCPSATPSTRAKPLADALAATDDFFPSLFREMIELGEQTGHLDAVLAQLADHYQNQIDMRRTFWAAITWPLVQLGLAVLIVGFLIWIMGVIRNATGSRSLDILGFGLVGNRGLAVYVGIVCWHWRGVLARPAGHQPRDWSGRGPSSAPCCGFRASESPLQTLALARLAWSMHVTMNAGMEVRRALRLSLRSTQNARYTDQIPAIDAEIMAGNSIHEAFCRAGGYPPDFLDTLAVGEQSGKVVESMGLLARQYQDRARAALAVLTIFAGWAVWAAIAILIIALIFRIFSFYLGAINDAMRP